MKKVSENNTNRILFTHVHVSSKKCGNPNIVFMLAFFLFLQQE